MLRALFVSSLLLLPCGAAAHVYDRLGSTKYADEQYDFSEAETRSATPSRSERSATFDSIAVLALSLAAQTSGESLDPHRPASPSEIAADEKVPLAPQDEPDEHVLDDPSDADLAKRLPTWIVPPGETEPPFLEYEDSAGRVVRLAGLETVSFRLNPKEWHGNHNDMTAYRQAFEKFPHIRACLTLEERFRDRPDLVQFDWQNINSHAEAYVCYGWMITSYATIGDFENWLRASGFSADTRLSEVPLPEDGTRRGTRREPRWFTAGGMRYDSVEQPYQIERSLLGRLRRALERKHYAMGAHFGHDGGLKNLTIYANKLK